MSSQTTTLVPGLHRGISGGTHMSTISTPTFSQDVITESIIKAFQNPDVLQSLASNLQPFLTPPPGDVRASPADRRRGTGFFSPGGTSDGGGGSAIGVDIGEADKKRGRELLRMHMEAISVRNPAPALPFIVCISPFPPCCVPLTLIST